MIIILEIMFEIRGSAPMCCPTSPVSAGSWRSSWGVRDHHPGLHFRRDRHLRPLPVVQPEAADGGGCGGVFDGIGLGTNMGDESPTHERWITNKHVRWITNKIGDGSLWDVLKWDLEGFKKHNMPFAVPWAIMDQRNFRCLCPGARTQIWVASVA